MDLKDIASIVTISAAISSIVSLSLQAYFKNKFENHFKLLEHRNVMFAKLVELVYRIRNIARDISIQSHASVSILPEELSNRTKELEETLFQNRMILEKNGMFLDIHAYKNKIVNFNEKLADISYFLEHDEITRAHNFIKELSKLYEDIDESYLRIVKKLSDR